MTGPFSTLLAVLAGACVLPFLVHLRLWWRSRQDLSQLWFAILGAGVSTYILCTIGLYGSRDLETYRSILRIQTWVTPTVLIALLAVARDLAGTPRSSFVDRILVPALALTPFVRALDDWAFLYDGVDGLGRRRLWNGEEISVLLGHSHPVGSIAIPLLFISCIVVLLARGVQAWNAGRNSSAGLLVLSSALLLGSGIADTLVVAFVLPFPYLSEPALAGVALLIGWKMQGDNFRAAGLRMEVEAGRAVLSALVEHASDLVTRMDPLGTVSYASPSAGRFVDGGVSAVVGRLWAEHAVPHHRAVLEACLERLRRGSDEERISYAIRTSGTESRWVETILGAHRDETGGLVEVHGVTRDIGEAMAREERLEALEGELREMNRDLERRVERRTEELSRTIRDLEAFASSASHDLKAPLRAMSGYAAALEEDHGSALPPEGRHWLARIRESSLRLGNLIESLLTLARTGQRVLQRESTDLGTLAREIVESLRASDPGREVVCSIAPGLVADCDPAMSRTILENLLGNAWKYSSRKERTVIEFGRDPEGWFFVRDEGAGFDMRWADQLFQSFQRLHRQEDFEGNGIGLASVRRMVELHGGDVRASSEPGRGATFRFHFGNPERSA